MPSNKDGKKEELVNINLLFSSVGSRLMTVFITNLIVVGIFGIVGYYLDVIFKTKPLLLFLFIVLSFPVSIALIIKKTKDLAKKLSKNK